MAIRYSSHLRERMVLRGISEQVIELTYNEAQARFWDIETGMFVAVKRHEFGGRERDMALIYTIVNDDVLLVTIHPLRENQRAHRIQTGRWQPL